MDSRRDFLKKAALLATGSGLAGGLPASISRALAIDPKPGSTFLDAEHIVILMQENRSFDHSYGTLRGVRGFNDPRAVTLPGGNPVWLQSNRAGETYAPFRLNIKDTNATWIGSLPHGWVDQSLARNEGRHNRWLDTKASGKSREFAKQPLTLGYYNREDIPFYYSLADAFTVCDQNFCSSLTGTTPNRLHLWTGTIRAKATPDTKACVRNEDSDLDTMVTWTTLPERLEDAGVSWTIYQNELTMWSGLDAESDSWLANYGDNPIEYFTQFNVGFAPRHGKHLATQVTLLTDAIAKLEAGPQTDTARRTLAKYRGQLDKCRRGQERWSDANKAKLTPRDRSLHRKAFITNEADPHFRELAALSYDDQDKKRTMQAPKGDVFHQFREDVRTGKLPTVSWLVAPENFSDHPSAPWYGAWYVSEALEILTQNPEVWKKTIFILCYDENDGYFDHVPPFVPPYAGRPETGKVSAGLDVALEHVTMELENKNGNFLNRAHAGPIGLGYRVPLVIASPWSRGGYVCSQVFDHTSIVQLVEKVLSHKLGREFREPNITAWRRAVCGDLTSVFRPYNGEKIELPKYVEREEFLGSIHRAQFKPAPGGFKKLTEEEMKLARENPAQCAWLPRQEKGTRPSCALPYELSVDGSLSADRKSLTLRLAAGKAVFGARAAGAPFHAYAPGNAKVEGSVRAYAVTAGDRLEDAWALSGFDGGGYHLCVHGPNGFFREFKGTGDEALLEVALEPARDGTGLSGNAVLRLANRESRVIEVTIEDAGYGAAKRSVKLQAAGGKGDHVEMALNLSGSKGWYDVRVRMEGVAQFERRFAGRLETGKESITDPVIGA